MAARVHPTPRLDVPRVCRCSHHHQDGEPHLVDRVDRIDQGVRGHQGGVVGRQARSTMLRRTGAKTTKSATMGWRSSSE